MCMREAFNLFFDSYMKQYCREQLRNRRIEKDG